MQTSVQLFNRLGYSQVTIRMIASELKISSGNLNYHFKKREDILEALYFEMVAEFDHRVETFKDKDLSLKVIKGDILNSMNRMYAYRFFWTDLYNLLSLNTKIATHFKAVYQKRVDGYTFLFDKLMEDGKMKTFSFEKERSFLIERMIDYSNTFIYASSIYGKRKMTKKAMDEQADILITMLYPYLSAVGKEELKAIVPTYFN